jgi:hypothetical protein
LSAEIEGGNRVLERICEPEKEEVTVNWRGVKSKYSSFTSLLYIYYIFVYYQHMLLEVSYHVPPNKLLILFKVGDEMIMKDLGEEREACIKVLSQNLPEGAEEDQKGLSQDTWVPAMI